MHPESTGPSTGGGQRVRNLPPFGSEYVVHHLIKKRTSLQSFTKKKVQVLKTFPVNKGSGKGKNAGARKDQPGEEPTVL